MKVPPIGSKERKDLIDFICLLWYKTIKPAKRFTSFVTLARIKRFVGFSERTISDLCKEREADLNRNQGTITRNKMDKYVSWVKRDCRKKVTIALRKLATREDTLKRMVGNEFEWAMYFPSQAHARRDDQEDNACPHLQGAQDPLQAGQEDEGCACRF